MLYQDTTVFNELQPEWNNLLDRAPLNNIFYTWEWHSSWWDAYQPGELFVITCRDNDGTLIGIAPLFIANEEQGRVVRIIGCVDVTDYLDWIVDRSCMETCCDAIVGFLNENRDQFDVIDLCNIPEKSPTNKVLPPLLEKHGFTVTTQQQEVCPIIVLPDAWEDYLAQLDKKQRHEVRRKLRRIHGVQQEVDWYIVNGRHDLHNEMSCFMELMAASDPEKKEFLQNQAHIRFFKNIMPIAQERGWLQMTFLTVGDDRVAGYINFVYDDRVLVYNSGLDPEGYGQLSPGIVLLAYNIQHAIEQGYKEYDFLRGDEIYKYRMGGQDTRVMNISAQ